MKPGRPSESRISIRLMMYGWAAFAIPGDLGLGAHVARSVDGRDHRGVVAARTDSRSCPPEHRSAAAGSGASPPPRAPAWSSRRSSGRRWWSPSRPAPSRRRASSRTSASGSSEPCATRFSTPGQSRCSSTPKAARVLAGVAVVEADHDRLRRQLALLVPGLLDLVERHRLVTPGRRATASGASKSRGSDEQLREGLRRCRRLDRVVLEDRHRPGMRLPARRVGRRRRSRGCAALRLRLLRLRSPAGAFLLPTRLVTTSATTAPTTATSAPTASRRRQRRRRAASARFSFRSSGSSVR